MKAKLLIVLTMSFMCLFGSVSSVMANEPEANNAETVSEISPRGEITEYKYKYINGVKYKRLWSVTGNYWIDPAWSPA